MPRKLSDLILYLYVYVDVALFMTAHRIEETFGRRNDLPRA